MATLRASLSEALFLAQTKGSRVGTVRGDTVNADLNVMKTVVTLDGDETANHIISLTPPVREGQVIVPALSKAVIENDVGTTLTVDIGTVSNPTAISDGLNLSAPGIKELGTKDTNTDTLSVGEELMATVKTASSLNEGSTIVFYFVTRSV